MGENKNDEEYSRRIEMKITVKKEHNDLKVPFNQIPNKMVYKAVGGAVLWKIGTNSVVLCGYNGCDYISIARGFKEPYAIEFLGEIEEIIIRKRG